MGGGGSLSGMLQNDVTSARSAGQWVTRVIISRHVRHREIYFTCARPAGELAARDPRRAGCAALSPPAERRLVEAGLTPDLSEVRGGHHLVRLCKPGQIRAKLTVSSRPDTVKNRHLSRARKRNVQPCRRCKTACARPCA